MRQSQALGRTRKEEVKDETSINAQLLTRAGFVEKLMAGVYSFLPLGFRVLSKIENIIREEMAAIGAQEVLLPALQPQHIWETTGRWESFEALFRLQSRYSDRGYAMGPTHEEVATPVVQRFVSSYKDLPTSVFQIQTKFRDEARARSGLLRGREFRMKDMYSFHATQRDLDDYYERVTHLYGRVFERLGLGQVTFLTYASGGSFSKYSHEFQAVTASGEDTIYVCRDKKIAINRDIFAEVRTTEEFRGLEFTEERAIEVGNIFKLGTRFTKAFGMEVLDASGGREPVLMGCYGMGPSRIMGSIVEVHHDARGMIWPQAVAPYDVHLLLLSRDEAGVQEAQKVYDQLKSERVDVLFDDRPGVGNGAKLNDCDLIGVPLRVVLSSKSFAQNAAEIKRRGGDEPELVPLENLVQRVRDIVAHAHRWPLDA